MRILPTTCLIIVAACVSLAQQQPAQQRIGPGAAASGMSSNLPIEKIGDGDLIQISVYDAPELTGTVRVNSDGEIRLPMLKQHIHAAGLYPENLENSIAAALTEENLFVEPIVTVDVVEYRSRPITVMGAVRNPTTFQADGPITLMDAISHAGGITENAGSEILVTHTTEVAGNASAPLTERVPVKSLMNPDSPSADLILQIGDIIRVPPAGQVYVVGDVNRPGTFNITDGSESSVLKALALSGGLTSFSRHSAYIYRVESGSTDRAEIPINLKKIMNHKTPDVPLMANDILYVPDATGKRIGEKTLETSLGLAIGAASLAIYATQ
jgi:polysaccharide biosynthesis/export protein